MLVKIQPMTLHQIFWIPNSLKSTHQDTQLFFRGTSLNVNLKHIIELFHCHIIPMTFYKDIMPYFDKYKHVYGWNISILWSPLKIWTPKIFTMANFRHPVLNSWLRPWYEWVIVNALQQFSTSLPSNVLLQTTISGRISKEHNVNLRLEENRLSLVWAISQTSWISFMYCEYNE